MGLFDFLKRKKAKAKGDSAREEGERMELGGIDLSGAEPLDTRYTQEYQDFLAAQEAFARGTAADAGDAVDSGAPEDAAEAQALSPEGESAPGESAPETPSEGGAEPG